MLSSGAGMVDDRRQLDFPPRSILPSSAFRPPVLSGAELMKTTYVPVPPHLRSLAQSWAEWQCDVLAILRRDFREVLQQISPEDVDWPAWLRFYLEGRTPSAAVDRALERDL